MPGVIEEADALFGVDPLIHEADAIFGVGGNQAAIQSKPPFELRMSTNGPPPAQGLANVPPAPTSPYEIDAFRQAMKPTDPAVDLLAKHQRTIPLEFSDKIERLRREKPEQFNRLLRSALNSAGNIWGTGDQPATGSKRQLILAARNLNAPLMLIPQVVAAMAGGTREDGPEWAKTILADVEAEGVVGKASGWDKVADGLNEVGSFLLTFGLGGPANPQKTAQTLATGSKFARGVEKGLSAVRMFATPFQAAGAAENVAAKLLPVRAEGRLYRMAGKLRDTVAAVFGFSAAHNLGEAAKGKESVVDAMAATLRAPKDAISDALATVYELPSMVREAKTPEGVQRMVSKVQNAAMILLPIANSARRWRAPVPPPGATQPEPPVFSAKDLADPANADQFVRVYPQQAEMLAATPTISRGAFAKLFGMPKDFARVDSVADRKTASQSVAAAIERAKVASGVREQLAQGNVPGAQNAIADSTRLTNPPAPPPPPAEPVYPLVPGEKLRRLRNAVGRKALSVDAVDAKVRSIGSQQAFKDSGLYTTDSIVDQYARALASRLPVSAVSQPEVAKGNVAAPAQPTETSNGKIEGQGQEKEVLLNSPDSNVAAPPAGTTPEPTASEGGARPLESRVTKVGKFWKVSDADGAIYPFEFKSQEQAVATIGALEKQLGDVPGKTGSDVPSDQRNPAQPVGGIPNGGREPGVPSDVPAAPPGLKQRVIDKANQLEADALKVLRAKGSQVNMNADPATLAALAKLGAAQLMNGSVKVADLAQHLTDRFGEAVNPYLDKILERAKRIADVHQNRLITAWHGTPHEFEKFTTSKIGTGEGAQAYGYGLYFASRKGIGEFYRNKLATDPKWMFRGKPISDYSDEHVDVMHRIATDVMRGRDIKMAIERERDGLIVAERKFKGWLDDALRRPHSQKEIDTYTDMYEKARARTKFSESVTESDFSRNSGNLYQVSIAPKEHELLDWDKPISQQSPIVKRAVRAAFKEIGLPEGGDLYYGRDPDGKRIMSTLHSSFSMSSKPSQNPAKMAADLLLKNGVRGVQFLDNTSRGGVPGLPRAVIDALEAVQNLGFDSPGEAMSAIRRHKDWKERWDFSIPGDEKHAAVIEKFLSGKLKDNGTHNYVIFNDADVGVKRVESGGRVKELNSLPDSIRARADAWEAEALKTIQSKGATLRSGLDPELLAAYIKYGAAQVLKGTAAVGDFTKHMIDKFGEEIRPQIEGIWQESKKLANRYGKPEPTSIVDDSVAAIGGVADEIKSAFAPATRGDAAKLTAQSMRAGLARQTQLRGSTEAAFAKATRAADKLSPPEQIKYYAALEKGAPTGDAKFDKAATALREMTDRWWSKVQAIKGGPERWIENYWARYWDLSQPGAKNTFDRVYGKRPLEGPKTFNRQRTIPTVQDGIDAGLKLAETNPLRAAQAKIFEMQRYVTAHEILRELKAAGLVKYVKGMSRGPDGYQPINDSLFTQFGRGKGTTILRRLWMPEPAAKIINNYLSQGLAGSTTYQLFRAAGNTMNQVQLGMSAFHAAFTTLDAMISTSASGLMKLESGARNLSPAEMLGGVAKLAEGATPLAAIRNVVRGRRMFKALRSDLSSLPDGPLKDQAQAIIEGGGRAAMDSFYHNNQLGKFLRAMKEGRFGAAAARSPLALVEALAWPIMERLVPYQKLGVASELARIELERLGPEAGKDQIREAMGRAWDSVDNRLGQMVYDNLFWNKTLKDIGMISVRSLGWNLGTIRELGGAIKDIPGAVGRFKSGDRIVTPRMAYAMVLPATVGLYGAIYGYLHGQKPEEMKDYFYPKTGKVNPDGSPERVSLPSYIKDIYAYSKHPITTVGHKLHPLIAATVEMINNQDYFGTKIRNEDDPAVKQVADSAKHIGELFIPFSVRNAMKRKEAGGSFKEQAESFLGITPAPREMERSDAQNVLAEHYAAQRPVGGRTQEAADKSKARRDLIEEARKDSAGVRTKLIQNIKSGSMSRDQALDVLRSAKLPAGESSIKYAPLDVALKAFRVATPAERDQWGKAVALKLMRAIKTMPRDQWNEHAREAIDLNVPIPDRTKKAILKRLGN